MKRIYGRSSGSPSDLTAMRGERRSSSSAWLRRSSPTLPMPLPRHVGTSWKELIDAPRRATGHALKLDPSNDMALIAKAMAYKYFEGKVDEALAIDRAVLERSPNFGPAHYSTAGSLWMSGR